MNVRHESATQSQTYHALTSDLNTKNQIRIYYFMFDVTHCVYEYSCMNVVQGPPTSTIDVAPDLRIGSRENKWGFPQLVHDRPISLFLKMCKHRHHDTPRTAF